MLAFGLACVRALERQATTIKFYIESDTKAHAGDERSVRETRPKCGNALNVISDASQPTRPAFGRRSNPEQFECGAECEKKMARWVVNCGRNQLSVAMGCLLLAFVHLFATLGFSSVAGITT